MRPATFIGWPRYIGRPIIPGVATQGERRADTRRRLLTAAAELFAERGVDGTSIDAQVGDTIVLRLSDNATGGYRWELEPVDGEPVVLESSDFETPNPAIGSGGVATWTLHAASPGTSTIRSKRWRPWEGDASVLARVTVTVHVHP